MNEKTGYHKQVSHFSDKLFNVTLLLYAIVVPLSISATYIALGLIIFAGLISIWRKGFRGIKFQSYTIFLFLLVHLWSAITALLAGNFEPSSAFRGMNELTPVLLIPFFLQATTINKEKIVMALIFSASFVCLLGLIQFFVPTVAYPLERQILFEGEFRGFFPDNNHFSSGGFFSITTVLIFALILFWRSDYVKKTLLILLLLLNMAAFSLTLARSYYVSVILIIVLLVALRSWKWLLLTFLCLLVLFQWSYIFPNHVVGRFQSVFNSNDVSRNERIHIWQAAVEIIKEHPVTGVGKGGWGKGITETVLQRYQKDWGLSYSIYANAHNIYLSVWAETGIIGLLLFLLFWGMIFWILVTKIRFLESGSFESALAIGTMSCLINLFAAGMFEYNFVTLVVLLLISLLVGISLSEPQVSTGSLDQNAVIAN